MKVLRVDFPADEGRSRRLLLYSDEDCRFGIRAGFGPMRELSVCRVKEDSH